MFMTYGFVGWLIFEPAWIGFISASSSTLEPGHEGGHSAAAHPAAVVADLVRRGGQVIRNGVMAPERVRQTFRWVMPRRAKWDRHRLFCWPWESAWY